MSSPSTFDCFGLVIHGLNADEAFKRADLTLVHGGQVFIVTTNPEILLEAKRDPAYWEILRKADLRLVDSFGLKIAGLLSGAILNRLTGVDFAERLLQESLTRGWKVGLVGGAPGVADKASWKIREAYSDLSIMSEVGGYVENDGSDDEAGAEARMRLTQYAPDILLVAFGHPKQEAWIARHLAEFPSVKIAMGVGGTLDYWSENVKRAPAFIRSMGLEWLWRLFQEPTRWKRIFNAVVVFPVKFLISKMGGGRTMNNER
ncbi:MAG: WecB/TagA/CpsF family glycosyltransferase [Patescibacteria group bacterium]